MPTDEGVYIIGEDGVLRDSIDSRTIQCLVPFRNNLWAIGSDGIYEYRQGAFKQVYNKAFVCNPTGLNAVVDQDNRLLIQDVQNIYRYDGSSLETVFTGAMVFDMLLDNEKNLWVATYTGLYNLFKLQFKNYALTVKDELVRSIAGDGRNVWAATLEGRLFRLDDNGAQECITPRIAGVSYFQGIPAVAGGTIYFPGGYKDGDVMKYCSGRGEWMKLPALAYNFVTRLPDGNLMLGGYNGMLLCNTAGNMLREFARNALQQSPYCIAADTEGKIWIGGSHGITLMQGDSTRLLKSPRGFLSCRTLVPDRHGKIWAASCNKLYRIENDSLVFANEFNDIIRSVYFTDNNTMLVGTLRGIHIRKSPDEGFLYYDQNNGFTGEKLTLANMAEDEAGNVWVLAEKSIARFNPDELLKKQPAPLLHLLSMLNSDNNIEWKSSESNSFSYRCNNIRFVYTGLCYSAASNIRYYYRLKGFQDKWSPPVSEREVTFNNLSPGTYEFEIYADAGTDDSRSETRQIRFTIRPAFWQTWWFVAVVVLLLMLASTGIALYIQRRKNERLIERLETETQLNELRVKSIRLRSIPHFNANVVAAIEYYIMNLSKDDASRLLNIYSEFTSQTLREVDKASRSLHDELDYVQLYLKLEKLRFMEKFNYEVDIDPEVMQDVQLPNMILHTYCENAVKHGFSGRASGCRLKISARQRDDVVEVCVEDNGVGRTAAAQNKNIRSTKQGLDILSRQIEIYNRFNKKKIVQRIVDLYDGDTPCGTRFMIEVPYGFAYQ